MRLIGVVVGTRPEVIKLAPVVERLRAADWCEVVLLPSGQHGPLLERTLAECGLSTAEIPPLPPTHPDPAVLVDLLAQRMRHALDRHRPDLVVVHGDTATALASARAAVAAGIHVAHVEAGLRTYDLANPFPEELHRQTIARLASWHFAPTRAAADNLLREGVPSDRVFVTGNTIVDSVLGMAPAGDDRGRSEGRHGLVTLHRRELLPHLQAVLSGLVSALDAHGDLSFRLPVHPNPAFGATIRARLGTHPRVTLCDPLPYARFLTHLAHADLVVTDSGGVQEEACVLGIPLVVARLVTERQEVLADGRGIVAGLDAEAIAEAIGQALEFDRGTTCFTGPLGDGRASERIEGLLRDLLARP